MRKLILSAVLSLAFLGIASEANEATAQRYGCSSQRYHRQSYDSCRSYDRYDGYYGRRYDNRRYYPSQRHYRHYEPRRRYYRRSHDCGSSYGISIRF